MSEIAKELLKISVKYLIAFIPLLVALFFIYQNSKLERANEKLTTQLLAQQIINKATLSAVTLFHQISLDNIKAKQIEGSEHVKIKTVIKTVLKDSECAVTDVPANVSSELQQYERSIRERASSPDPSAPIK